MPGDTGLIDYNKAIKLIAKISKSGYKSGNIRSVSRVSQGSPKSISGEIYADYKEAGQGLGGEPEDTGRKASTIVKSPEKQSKSAFDKSIVTPKIASASELPLAYSLKDGGPGTERLQDETISHAFTRLGFHSTSKLHGAQL